MPLREDVIKWLTPAANEDHASYLPIKKTPEGIRPAIPGKALEAGRALTDFITLPGEAYQSGIPEDAIGRTVQGALTLSNNPYRQDPNALGIFGSAIGAKRRFAPEELAKAEQALTSGADTWNSHGFTKGKEGNMRFEINDQPAAFQWTPEQLARIATPMESMQTKGVELGDFPLMQEVFQHPELYQAYPELSRLPIVPYTKGGNTRGFFNPDEGKKFLGLGMDMMGGKLRPSTELKDTLIHELQHAVQDVEGLPPGYSPERSTPYVQVLNQALNNMPKDNLPEHSTAPIDLYTALKQVPNDVYNRTAGEVEARNASYRAQNTPKFNKHVAPQLTTDIPAENQIINPESLDTFVESYRGMLGSEAQAQLETALAGLDPQAAAKAIRMVRGPISPGPRSAPSLQDEHDQMIGELYNQADWNTIPPQIQQLLERRKAGR